MNAAEHVINRLGGTRAAAAALGLPPSTIQSWKANGLIPARRQSEVISAAKQRGIDISADEILGINISSGSSNGPNDVQCDAADEIKAVA